MSSGPVLYLQFHFVLRFYAEWKDAEVSAEDMEDMIQSAALVYWKRLQAGIPAAYCFVAARGAAATCYYPQILGRARPKLG